MNLLYKPLCLSIYLSLFNTIISIVLVCAGGCQLMFYRHPTLFIFLSLLDQKNESILISILTPIAHRALTFNIYNHLIVAKAFHLTYAWSFVFYFCCPEFSSNITYNLRRFYCRVNGLFFFELSLLLFISVGRSVGRNRLENSLEMRLYASFWSNHTDKHTAFSVSF